jgi:sugar phosphate isomerase/epimerase
MMAAKSVRTAIECSTGPFWAFELEQTMDILAEAGFRDIELMVTRDPKTQEPEHPLRLAAERGLNITSLHGPFLVITKGVWGLDPLGKIERGVEMCKALGARSLIVHPPYLWESEYATWVREESAGYSAEQGVAVAVENMYPKWVAGRRLRAYRWLEPAALLHAAAHVVMDTSHLAVSRQDILDGYAVLQPRLIHIHLSNNAGDGKDGHLEIHKGTLPLDRLLGELRRTKYAGVVSLELSVTRYLERPHELAKMLRRNREHVESKLAGRTRNRKGIPRG